MRRRLRDRRERDSQPPDEPVKSAGVDWQERAQFFSLAATAMRRFRAARARERRAYRRDDADTMDALDELLSRLESLDPRQARIVAMRCFDGLTVEQTAQVLGISDETVEREWTHARAWLRLEMSQRSS
ncbi:sigma-70 family RNA polymerase sigma factor [Peristeroidobacter soli]|jgi:RNA polymerase sigma factor (sigma-70 family)|uniref:sigma-70 family RNA polymerase sigma factor n=1 Tax=Peristeroidobacter soli TaxID=2497877 RepID=UPI0013007F8D|nr:sigma-70 family RNA polymerase sigma factor [Peristeroidobacter soli]